MGVVLSLLNFNNCLVGANEAMVEIDSAYSIEKELQCTRGL